jgi:HD-GYP domain-containing protein (c-di-GMP phosphodiesterase class II)
MRISRECFLHDLKPGMILAKAVIADDGRTIIGESTVLTKRKISLLRAWAVSAVEVLDMGNHPGNSLSYAQFVDVHSAMTAAVSEIFEKTRLSKTLSLAEIDELVKQSQDIIVGEVSILSYLASIHTTDDYIFKHSVNVGILAGLIGKWTGYTVNKLKQLMLAGFLHDIGKTQIPLRILNKPGKLDSEEWKAIKRHPVIGFELLRSPVPPPETVLSGVLQHHERMDGSGYPHGLLGNDIILDAKIIAIADIYDAMTSDRSYRAAETPFRAIEEIHGQMFGKLDPAVSNIFIAKARESFIGMEVRLSDGCEATVIAIDQTTAKPLLRTRTGHYTNLAQSGLTITRVIPGG